MEFLLSARRLADLGRALQRVDAAGGLGRSSGAKSAKDVKTIRPTRRARSPRAFPRSSSSGATRSASRSRTGQQQIVTDNSLDDSARRHDFAGVALRQACARLDASMLLWLALIAVLVFLVAQPDGAAGHLELPGDRDRPLHARQLPRRLWQRPASAGAAELARARRRRRAARQPVRRADRLGDLAHRHAGARASSG